MGIALFIILLLGLITMIVFTMTVIGIILHLRTAFKEKMILKE